MERNINNKKMYKMMGNIKNILIVMVLLILLPLSYAQDNQNEILIWDFETGTGSIVLDNSDNAYHGIFYNQAQYTSTHKFGSYGVQFDGSNDYIVGSVSEPLSDEISVSLWVSPWTSETDFPLTIYDENFLMRFGLIFDVNNGKGFYYYNTTNDYKQVIFISNSLSYDFHNFIFTLNTTNKEVKFYIDSVLIGTQTLNDILITDYNYKLILGTDMYQGNDYTGFMDEIKLYDFILNQSQINEIYTTNNVTLFIGSPDIPEINDTINLKIINSTSINKNDTFDSQNIYLDVFLNEKANCEIYLDNELIDKSSQLLAFKVYFTDLEIGEHSYFLYCSNIENATLKYDTTNMINFEILPPAPFTLTFNVIGNDFDVTKESLYIVSPCMDDGFSTIGTDKLPFRKEYNQGGIQFAKVKNGLATLTLNETSNEFCLFNGEVRYNTESVRSYDYDIVSANKQINLGVIKTPNNISNNYYSVPLDKFEIYTLISPEAYGKKWDGTLVLGILMFLIGCLIIFMGIRIPDGKVVMAGVFVLLIGTGFSIGGIVGILI